LLATVAAILTIFSTLNPFFGLSNDEIGKIHSWTLVGLVLALMAYIFYRETGKKYKLSEYVIFSHYINHIARDLLVDNKGYSAEETIRDILSAIAESFSIVCNKKCNASIKLYNKEGRVELCYTDRLYENKGHPEGAVDATRYTSIKNILSGESPRYFLSNNLPFDFKNNRYKHPLLEDYKPFSRHRLFKFVLVPQNWPLPFMSTLVVPIRYVDDENVNFPKYYGFLCIDCDGRNSFDQRYYPEMAAATADIIYALSELTRNEQVVEK